MYELTPEYFIAAFKADRHDREVWTQFREHWLPFAQTSEIARLIGLALRQMPGQGAPVVHAASRITQADFDALIPLAVEGLHGYQPGPPLGSDDFYDPRPWDCSEQFIRFVSRKYPAGLRPHLERLFDLDSEWDIVNAFIWRGAGPSAIPFLQARLLGPSQDPSDRFRAWECLLQLRLPQAFALVLTTAGSFGIAGETLERHLISAGVDAELRPLIGGPGHVLVFESGYFLDRDLADCESPPSSCLPSPTKDFRFGGPGSCRCGMCGGQLHHILNLPESIVFPSEDGDSTSPDDCISLETCLSCIWWEKRELIYRHDADGLPQSLDKGRSRPKYPVGPLKTGRVRLAPIVPDALIAGHAYTYHVGGEADWIQSAHHPTCPDCRNSMHFLMQIGSGIPLQTYDEEAAKDHWFWTNEGDGYAFRCTPCRTTAFLCQCS